MEYVEGLLDCLWEGNLDDLRLFRWITERVEEVHDDREERLCMALEQLDAAEEQRREDSTTFQERMNELASRNQQLEGKVLHLEGAYVTLTDQVCRGIRNSFDCS